MPPLGQTSDEIRIAAWLKQAGDEVGEGEPLLEVETDKATLEVEASSAGVLLAIVHEAGTVVTAGDLIGWIGAPGEEIPAARGRASPRSLPRTSSPPSGPTPSARPGRALATPVVRALAREHGVDINLIQGSGPGGRVERQDVLAATAPAETEGQPVPAHRRAIAAPADAGRRRPAVLARGDRRPQPGARRSRRDAGRDRHAPPAARRRRCAREHPALNRTWVEDGPRLRAVEPIRVGLAVAAEDRLVVPTLVEPDRSRSPISSPGSCGRRRRPGGRIAAPYTGTAAVTVSNLGMFGVDWFQAIVDPDQAAILAAGAIARRPVVTADGISAVPQIELVLTVDHRVADGVAAARFLQTVKAAPRIDQPLGRRRGGPVRRRPRPTCLHLAAARAVTRPSSCTGAATPR